MTSSKCHNALQSCLGLFYPALALAATVFFAGAAQANMRLDPACVLREGAADSCTHVVACIGGNTLFVGGSVGWNAGTLYGELYSGTPCKGVWDSSIGRAEFICADGTTGSVAYTSIDGPTGTTIGGGTTLDGRPVEAWSGHAIAAFIERETGRVTLQCGVQELLMM
ncbi:MAG: hypothetical protein RLZZ491_2783 [Pseudomonadota bacterium]